MKFESFDRTNLKIFRQEIEMALKEITEKYGIQFEVGSIKFSSNEFSTKLTANLGEKKSKADTYEQNWLKYAKWYGMNPEDLGKTFSARGKTFKIVGLDPKQRKNNIMLESNGKGFKAPAEMVKRNLI